MKNFFSGQIKGLIWFVVLYALLRAFFLAPESADQGMASFAIVLSSLAFVWLIFPLALSMGGHAVTMSLSFLSLSGYSLFTWTKFDPAIISSAWFQNLAVNDDKMTLLAVLFLFIAAVIITAIDLVTMLKKKNSGKKTGVIAASFFVGITAVIVIVDLLMPVILEALGTIGT